MQNTRLHTVFGSMLAVLYVVIVHVHVRSYSLASLYLLTLLPKQIKLKKLDSPKLCPERVVRVRLSQYCQLRGNGTIVIIIWHFKTVLKVKSQHQQN